MQFGKSSEKLRAKTERQIQEAQERISALQEEMAETLGEQYHPVLPSALRQSSARKPLPASLPRETRVIRWKRNAVLPVVVKRLFSLDVMCQSNWSLSAAPLRLSKHNVLKQACCRC